MDYYVRIKEKYGIPDGVMELEVTESLALGGEELLCQLVCELQARGFTCSLDDFGSGYSSLNLLKNLPIRVLKLDILFSSGAWTKVREPDRGAQYYQYGAGIEDPGDRRGRGGDGERGISARGGCDIVQGYVFARPMPLAEFEALLAEAAGK